MIITAGRIACIVLPYDLSLGSDQEPTAEGHSFADQRSAQALLLAYRPVKKSAFAQGESPAVLPLLLVPTAATVERLLAGSESEKEDRTR